MPTDIKHVLARLAKGTSLESVEIADALAVMTDGAATPAQMAAFLMGLAVRGETVAEITGAVSFLRSRMTPIAAPKDAVDIVGTGGDGHGTYNVSTCAALVAAGAGVTVAKHGNRSVSSKSGASDVLAALGVRIDASRETVAHALRAAGVGFLWAPIYHPAMKAWAPVRAELGIRTLFNLLGPLCNPAGVTRQVIGVFDSRWVLPFAEVLRTLGANHVWVVHGADGLDELSTTGVSRVAELKGGDIRQFEVSPEEAGLSRATLAHLQGGDAAMNAAAIRAVLAGTPGPFRDIVLLNAAAVLIVADKATTLKEGVALAAHAIAEGRAASALARLVAATTAETDSF